MEGWGWVEIRGLAPSLLQHGEMRYAMAARGYWVQDGSDNAVEKSKVKLTSGRPEDTILVEVQSGSRWWRAMERIFTSLRRRSWWRMLFILFPATSLEATSFIWLSCSCSDQVALFPSGMLRWKENYSLNSPYMTGKKYMLMLQFFIFLPYLFLTCCHFSPCPFQFCRFSFPLPTDEYP